MKTNRAIEAALRSAVDDGVFPGAVLAVRLRGEVQCLVAAGQMASCESDAPVKVTTVYDLASLTKPLATTTAILLLIQEGRLGLRDQVCHVLTELKGSAIGEALVQDLLSHSSGLPGWRPIYEKLEQEGATALSPDQAERTKERVVRLIRDEALVYANGEKSLYSDLGFMLLGFMVERISHTTLDQFAWQQCFQPLGAEPLLFCPLLTRRPEGLSNQTIVRAQIAPTEFDTWRNRQLQGEVHDENAAALGGVAGHAGLFGTAEAVLAVSGAWLAAYHQRPSILATHLVTRFTTRTSHIRNSSWALGWDTPSIPSSSGSYFSPKAFGHLGYTGTSLWIDPTCELEVVLLSNRVYPTRKNEKIREFRPLIHDLVYGEYVAGR
jgi:CubicO group peptidase (beta-lactamase class C family)